MEPSPLARAFVRWAFLRAALARGWWLCTAVHLVTDARLAASELLLIAVFQGITVVAAEVPAGIVADAVSRRRILIAAHVVMGSGMALTALTDDVGVIVVSQCLWGLGWALSSGADTAWISDELGHHDPVDCVLVAQARSELCGTAVGIVGFAALGWATTLRVAMVAAGAAMVLVGLTVVARWPETWRPRATGHDRRRTAGWAVTREAIGLARGDPVVRALLAATLVFHGGQTGVGRLFEQRLVAVGLPDEPGPVVWFGAVGLLAAVIGAVTLRALRHHLVTASNRRAYVAASAVAALGALGFAHAESPSLAIAASLLISGVGVPAVRAATTISVDRRTPSHTRATVHSLVSQAENIGEVTFGLVLAGIARSASPTITLSASAALFASAAVLVARRPRPVSAPTTRPSGEHGAQGGGRRAADADESGSATSSDRDGTPTRGRRSQPPSVEERSMASVRPHLWFSNNQAAEAARFYAAHIPDSTVTNVVTAPEGMPGVPEGAEFIVEFTVAGLPVVALNAGQEFTLDEAFSFYLSVDTQDEVDHYWALLTADGGQPGPCGWCKDRFGVSWQVVPKRLEELCGDYSTDANKRAMNAMLAMGKIDIAALEQAHAGPA